MTKAWLINGQPGWFELEDQEEFAIPTIAAPDSPADGQLLRWDATLGEWAPTNPVGNSLNAKAQNVTGVATAVTGASGALGSVVALPGTAISVTNSGGRDVEIEFECGIQQSVVGTGQFWLALEETTSGSTYRRYCIKPLPGVTTNGLNRLAVGKAGFNIGVVTTSRAFQLRAGVFGAAGVTPAVSVINQASDPTRITARNQ